MFSFQTENKLVELAKSGNSQALEQLVNKYKPLIYNTISQYHLYLYDEDDWLQDARIECFLTAQKFDPTSGSKFGSFFKLRFQNMVRSKLRKQLAQKRRTDYQAASLDEILQQEYDAWPQSLHAATAETTPICHDFKKYTQTLSQVEVQALLVNMGQKQADEVLNAFQIDAKTLKNAQQRVRMKFRHYLKNEIGRQS